MSLFSGILSDQLITAIGWTLFHSLWQGVIIALLFTLLYYKFRHHRAEMRYLVSVSALLVLFLAVAVTFTVTYAGSGQVADATTLLNARDGILPAISLNMGAEATGDAQISRFHTLIQFLPDRFSIIVNLWIIGLILITLRLAGSVIIAYRYKRTNLATVPDSLIERFTLLVDRINVSGRVKLLGSELAKNPMVIGYLKPVVLIPASAISHLPCEQLDAILVHELAHIKRHDFMINVFQNIVELLLFFHPVVWYLNHQIRKERENCCDDMAVAYGGSMTYAKALSKVHEIQYYPKLALALSVRKNHLLNRVVRILKPKKMKTNVFDKLITGAVLLAALSVILISTGATYSQNKEAEPVQNNTGYLNKVIDIAANELASNAVVSDNETPAVIEDDIVYKDVIHDDSSKLEIKDNVITRTIDDNGKVTKYKMVVKEGEVTELYVDGKKIPEKDHGEYQAVIDETLEDVIEMKHALAEARIDLEEIDWEEMKHDIQESLTEVMEIDIDHIRAELESIEIPEIDFQELQEEIEMSLEIALESLEEIDFEEIREEMEEVFRDMEFENQEEREQMEQEMQEELQEAMEDMEEERERIQEEMEELREEMAVEYEAEMAEAEHEIQQSIAELEEINTEEIQAEMERAMQELSETEIDMELELKKIDEMIEEIEKLEIEEL